MKFYYYYPEDEKLIPKEDSKEKGVLVVVGESQKENDNLVKDEMWDGEEYWFHVADCSSGHAIYEGDTISNDAVIQIASLVKQRSKLKDSKNVKVNYLKLKYVKSTKTLGSVLLTKTPETVKV